MLQMKDAASILLVDDDWHLVQSMAEWLREIGHTVQVADCLSGAKASLAEHSFDLLITDLRLKEEDGFELIGHARQKYPSITILVMTGYATPDTAIEAIKAGAFDLLTKPLIDDELNLAISRAVSQRDIALAMNLGLASGLFSRFGIGHEYSEEECNSRAISGPQRARSLQTRPQLVNVDPSAGGRLRYSGGRRGIFAKYQRLRGRSSRR